MSDKDPKSIQLDKTIGSVSAEKLDETRKHVAAEMEAARKKLDDDEETPTAAESPAPSPEDERLRKLDIITDVQLVLVEKYRKAAQLMWVAIVCLILCLLGLIGGALIGIDIQNKIAHMLVEQKMVLSEQKAAKQAAEAAKEKANETAKKVDETSKKVDEAVEASPKIEIDAQGKAKVVVPVRKKEEPSPKAPPTTATGSPPPPAPPPPKGEKGETAEFPIQLR